MDFAATLFSFDLWFKKNPREKQLKMQTETLSEKNPIPAFAGVTFDEPSHTYTLDGVVAPTSVTQLIKPLFDEFDPSNTVDKYFEKWRRTPSSPYYHAIHQAASDDDAKTAILQMWSDKGAEACRLGTKTHKTIEHLLNGGLLADCDVSEIGGEIEAFQQFDKWMQGRGLVAFRTELLLFHLRSDGQIAAGGAIDALYQNSATGELVLVDWKRSKPFGPHVHAPFAKPGYGIASTIHDSQFDKYALQLALYSAILKRHKVAVTDKMLVRVTANGEYEAIDASGSKYDVIAETLLDELA